MKIPLQRLRKEAGFKSAKAFAASLDIPVATYTDWEQGRRLPALDTLWLIADALGEALGRHVSLDELAGRDWPRIEASLSDDERLLVEQYRHTDDRGRAAIVRTAEGESGMGADQLGPVAANGVS